MKELDLHGVKHAEVPREIDKFVGGEMMSGTKLIMIITGNSDEMKKIVESTMCDYNIAPARVNDSPASFIFEIN